MSSKRKSFNYGTFSPENNREIRNNLLDTLEVDDRIL
jgi:hypothetical protein